MVRRGRVLTVALAVSAAVALVAPPPAGAATRYEAESARIYQGSVASNYPGYSGTGFVDGSNFPGSYVEWTVQAAAAGTTTLALRYANGTTSNRPSDILVNGTVVSAARAFAPTGAWSTWATSTLSVSLRAGTNTVRARATAYGGNPNFDYLDVGTASADTQPPTTPGAPSCSSVGDTSLTLSWGASTDNVGVAGYDIYHDGNKLGEAAGTATSQVLTGLTPATQYRLSVFARDAAGNASASSAQAICTTAASSDTQPPTAPANLTASGVSANSVSLSWTRSTDNRGVTSYEVRSGGTVYATVTGTPPATSTTVTGLACASPYSLTVVARDAAGNTSSASNTVTFTTAACGGGVPSGITQISSGWTVPWGVAWLPDGQSALVTERDSFTIHRVTLSGTKTLIGTMPNTVGTGGEGGLLGVAVDPNWTSNHYVYFYHTGTEGNRVARMTYDGTTLSGYTALVTGIPKNRYHNGGRLAFGPDGYLYATTGDAQTPNEAQNRDSLGGKVLRMTTTGAPAPGNPFGTLVYSYGHRNPQGIAFDAQGRLWEAEFGNNRVDELNLIKPGLNYGWPVCEGTCSTAGMTNPAREWAVSTASPSAIAVVGNAIYMAAQRGERLWRIPLGSGETTGTPTAYFVGSYGRLRTVVKVPGADQLWLTTTNSDVAGGQPAGSDRIFRVTIS
ncbi:PQQ-dependent sugar dehydrogenase [Sphaerisporangium sp. B11E5]|uniref:PQQ-dependent sugar dehydrogenase n=1 Tax=Sphaerisporangium sp. B11E5 TaxID=3153563 RepID=UPI00325DE449